MVPSPVRGAGSVRRGRMATNLRGGLPLSQTEIQKFGAMFGQDDISGLEITMHQPLFVCLVKCISNLNRTSQKIGCWNRSFFKNLGERLPFEVFHHEVVDPTFMTNVVQGADIGMIQARDSAGLSVKSLPEIRIRRQMRGHYLNGYGSVKARVFRLIDFPHPASPSRGNYLVRTQLRTVFKRQCSSSTNSPEVFASQRPSRLIKSKPLESTSQ